jgi:UDP-2,3-diacylglucosamine pyrophosphatase LpxH
MIVVISDLHFEEEASDVIPGNGKHPDLIFRRNLDAHAYRRFITQMAEEARRRKVKKFQLVIAGDLFDLNRTALWFKDDLRPYVALEEIEPPLEAKLKTIVEAIAAEPSVAETLEIFRLLAKGRYREPRADGGKECDFPASKIEITCLAGNHDRLINASGICGQIRKLIGLSGDKPFPHYVLDEELQVLIRHGHEYDRNNFALDPDKFKTIPLEVPEEGYDKANFGDFVTIDVAAKLPVLFRQEYGDEAILNDKVLSGLYLRLLQFDDVRPQSALLDYLLDASAGDYSTEEAWERLVPVIQKLLDQVHDDKFFRHWISERARKWAPAEMDVARGLLKLGAWKNAVAREASRKIAHFLLGGETDRPELFAMREELVLNEKVRLVLAGHTHTPYMSLIRSDRENDRFYLNTGTWRDQIPSTPDQRNFGRLKALTYAMLFSPEEEEPGRQTQLGSFDYWTGYTREWTQDNQQKIER